MSILLKMKLSSFKFPTAGGGHPSEVLWTSYNPDSDTRQLTAFFFFPFQSLLLLGFFLKVSWPSDLAPPGLHKVSPLAFSCPLSCQILLVFLFLLPLTYSHLPSYLCFTFTPSSQAFNTSFHRSCCLSSLTPCQATCSEDKKGKGG